MDKYTIDESQYKNGYAKGYEDGKRHSEKMVLCGECLHHEGDACFHPKQESGWNSEGGEHLLVNTTDFCSYGERKNEKT